MAVITGEETGFPETAIAREYEADPYSVRQAREAVVAFAERHGAAGTGVDDIRTAMSEAATNVIMHAYDGMPHGRFRVLAVVGGDQMLVVIDDDGCGMSAPTLNPGLGMGLRVMEAAAEEALFLSREAGGSTVQLRFQLRS
jgi:anti-sigma regulatory factor (Ser/Thr protein kinase)